MEGSDGVLGQVEGGEGAGKLAVDRGQVRSLVVHHVFIFITDGVSDLDRPINVTLTRESQKGGPGPHRFSEQRKQLRFQQMHNQGFVSCS